MGIVIKTVVLTGATGYLGARLLTRLIELEYKVCVIKRESSKIEDLNNDVLFYNNDQLSIKKLFAENIVDLVIHTATAYGRKGESLLEIKNTNLDFPLLILNEVLANKTPYFINTGTSLPFLTNQYSLFKNQFSECLEFFKSQLTSINILLEHFYGPGDDESKFITAMINKMKSNVSPIELTAGTQIRDFIYIEDVLDAYFTILDKLDHFKEYTNLPLGSGNAVSIRTIVESIKKESNSNSELLFGAIAMRETELMKSDADISLLKQIGWKPKISLNEGLKMTIQS